MPLRSCLPSPAHDISGVSRQAVSAPGASPYRFVTSRKSPGNPSLTAPEGSRSRGGQVQFPALCHKATLRARWTATGERIRRMGAKERIGTRVPAERRSICNARARWSSTCVVGRKRLGIAYSTERAVGTRPSTHAVRSQTGSEEETGQNVVVSGEVVEIWWTQSGRLKGRGSHSGEERHSKPAPWGHKRAKVTSNVVCRARAEGGLPGVVWEQRTGQQRGRTSWSWLRSATVRGQGRVNVCIFQAADDGARGEASPHGGKGEDRNDCSSGETFNM
jgi:hypothetical protein